MDFAGLVRMAAAKAAAAWGAKRRGLLLGLAAVLAGALAVADGAHAQAPPATQLVTAPLVTPTNAWSFYGSSTTHTTGLAVPAAPEITAVARSLLANRNLSNSTDFNAFVQNVYDYVHNNINTEFRFGLSKGGRGALIDQSGTAFDQADLMVKLLAAEGVGASYQVGTITLSAQQFGVWSGVFSSVSGSDQLASGSLSGPSQTVTVDAGAACQFLADGGIPATVNGASSCSGFEPPSGLSALSTVTMAHIWVVVNGVSYDPAYKTYTLNAGVNLPSVMGCGSQSASTCGSSLQTAGMTGATTGTQSGINYLDSFNLTQARSTLAGYKTALATYIKTGQVSNEGSGASVFDVLGGRKLYPQSEADTAAGATYTGNGGAWSAIPDVYRTKLLVEIYSTSCEAFFADEVAGRVLQYTNASATSTQPYASTTFYYAVDGTNVASLSYVAAESCGLTGGGYMQVGVDHPYAANGGLYADQTVAFTPVDPPSDEVGQYRAANSFCLYQEQGCGIQPSPGSTYYPTGSQYPERMWTGGAGPITIMHEFGQAGMSAEKIRTDIVSAAGQDNITLCNLSSSITYIVSRTCHAENQPTVAATLASTRTLADALVDGVAKTVSTRHHDIGIIYGGRGAGLNLVTMQESLSVAPMAGFNATTASGVSLRQAAFDMHASMLSEVEARANPIDSGEGISAAAMFFVGKTSMQSPPVSPTISAYEGGTAVDGTAARIFDVQPSQMATFVGTSAGSYANGVVPNTTVNSAYTVIQLGYDCNGMTYPAYTGLSPCWRQQQLQAVATAGYSTLISLGGLGELSYVNGETTGPSGGTTARALTMWEYLKGGGVIGDPTSETLNTTKVHNEGSRARKFLSISPSSGNVAFTPAPDIVTGAGDFPESLSFQRSFTPTYHESTRSTVANYQVVTGTGSGINSSTNTSLLASGPDNAYTDRLGGGWTHNLQVKEIRSVDLDYSLGSEGAYMAADTIADLQAMLDLGGAGSSSTTLAPRVSALFALSDISRTFEAYDYNTILVKAGPQSVVFHRTWDQNWFAPKSPSAQFNYTTNTYTGLKGDTIAFIFDHYAPDGVGVVCTPSGGGGALPSLGAPVGGNNEPQINTAYEDIATTTGNNAKTFNASTWTFPNGLSLQFNYTQLFLGGLPCQQYGSQFVSSASVGNVLTSVSNNLGHSLTFSYEVGEATQSSSGGGGYAGILITGVTDENGRKVTFGEQLSGSSTNVFDPDTYTVTDPLGYLTTYHYSAGAYEPSPALTIRNTYQLVNWYSPGDSTRTYQSLSYDALSRVSQVTDRNGHMETYYPSGLFDSELWKRTETLDPIGNRSLALFDQYNGNILSQSPLGLMTTKIFDSAERLLTTTLPKGVGTTNVYDVRDNVLSVTRFGPGIGTTTTSTIYGAGGDVSNLTTPSTVTACAAPVTCNLPFSDTDANGNSTTYTWNADGQVATIIRPPDISGYTPETDAYYSTYSPSGGGVISLLTAKVDWIAKATSVNTTTGYAYNASNHYVLQSVTADDGGLNLTTGFTFDAYGNVLSVTTPKGYVSNYSWDADRRLTLAAGPVFTSNGSSVRTATQELYNADDDLIETDKGTLASNGAFTALETSVFAHDQMGNLIQTAVYNGSSTSSSNPPLTLSQTAYDADDRVMCVDTRQNPAVFSALLATPAANSASASVLPTGACSLSAVGSASQDLITETVYDADSRKTQEIRGLNTSAQITYATYGYTPDGKVATVADADDNLTAYSYDGFDRVIYTIFPSKTLSAGYADASDYEFYVYDANDNRTAVTRRDGLTNRFFFDKLNRQYEALIPSPAEGGGAAYTVNTCYDLLGRKLASAYVTTGPGVETCPLTSSTGMVAWTYDDVGRKTSETTTTASGAFTVGISYDADGDRSTLTWPDGQQLSYSFDTADHFTGVGDAYAGANPAYDSLGRVIGIGRANNASTSNITYDNADRLTGFTHGFPSGAATWSFGLSPASQILSASVNTSAYDWTGGVTGTVTNTPNGLNQDAAIAAVNSGQGYDKLGNLINDGTRQFTYDGENRLVSESGPASMSLVYDASGRLQQTTINGTTTQFVYEGASLVAEYSGATVLRRYVNGPGADQPLIWFEGSSVAASNARYFYADHQGSILQVADNNGNLISGLQYQYDPYGNPSSWTGSRFLYTGQMALPGTSLYYYKARVYDPVNQRFLQTDPVGYKDQMNLYEYVGDDPVDKTDPTGKDGKAALAVLEVTGTLDLEEEAGGTNANPAVDVAQALTTVVGLGVAGYELFQPAHPNGPTIVHSDHSDDAERGEENEGPLEQDGVGKIKGRPSADEVADKDLLDAERQVEESLAQREREQARYPRGSRNGNQQQRDDDREWRKHQDKIEEEKRLRDELKRRIKEMEDKENQKN